MFSTRPLHLWGSWYITPSIQRKDSFIHYFVFPLNTCHHFIVHRHHASSPMGNKLQSWKLDFRLGRSVLFILELNLLKRSKPITTTPLSFANSSGYGTFWVVPLWCSPPLVLSTNLWKCLSFQHFSFCHCPFSSCVPRSFAFYTRRLHRLGSTFASASGARRPRLVGYGGCSRKYRHRQADLVFVWGPLPVPHRVLNYRKIGKSVAWKTGSQQSPSLNRLNRCRRRRRSTCRRNCSPCRPPEHVAALSLAAWKGWVLASDWTPHTPDFLPLSPGKRHSKPFLRFNEKLYK